MNTIRTQTLINPKYNLALTKRHLNVKEFIMVMKRIPWLVKTKYYIMKIWFLKLIICNKRTLLKSYEKIILHFNLNYPPLFFILAYYNGVTGEYFYNYFVPVLQNYNFLFTFRVHMYANLVWKTCFRLAEKSLTLIH